MRYALACFLWSRTRLDSVRLCGLPIGDVVHLGVHQADADFIAHVTGIGRCSSPWACPICAPPVREGRAKEIDQALRNALEREMSAVFVTLTIQHGSSDPLEVTFERLRTGHRATHSGRVWMELREALGYVGAIRAWEITYGVNGWHPHCHEVLVFERQLLPDEVVGLEAHFAKVYGRALAKHGLTLHPVHGVDVRPVHSAGDLGGYLTKVEGGWGAGLELARSDLKRGRRGGRSPFELLADAYEGDAQALRCWLEYESGTKGKRAISWSPGLRKRLLEVAEEEAPTDEDLAAIAPDADEVWGIDLPPAVWIEVRRGGGIAELMRVCEDEARNAQASRRPDGSKLKAAGVGE